MFEVWAPLPAKVELLLDGTLHPMTRDGQWWRTDLETVTGADYGFVLDGSAPLPDPKSRRQPDGVHGLSRCVPTLHPAAFEGRQLKGGVIYELHVGTFTPAGTLHSAIEKLDHLVELGVDFVELLPVNAFNGEWNWGYDGVLWYAVQESYGGPGAYVRFVDACHERGLGVIQDVVYNHLGPSGNYLPKFGPYLVEGSSNTWGDSLNLADPEVREYIIGNALMWLGEYGVDGLRLDAVHALVDPTGKHLLQELSERVDALAADLGRPLSLIAESDLNDPQLVTPRDHGGYGLTAQWDDDYHHAVHVALTGETGGYYGDFDSLAALGKVLTRGFFHDGTWSSFRGREHGFPIDTASLEAWRMIGYAQDHDQIGNRAAGDRLSATLDERGLELAAVLALASPFTPMLFMGEEWGASTPWQFFTSHPEPELGAATATGRLEEFTAMGWDPDAVPDPQDPATFTRSKLDWSEAQGPLLDLHRRLIRLRRELPGLTDPSFENVRCTWDEEERWLLIERPGVCVVVNFADETRVVACSGRIVLETRDAMADGDTIVLPARSAAIVGTAPEWQ